RAHRGAGVHRAAELDGRRGRGRRNRHRRRGARGRAAVGERGGGGGSGQGRGGCGCRRGGDRTATRSLELDQHTAFADLVPEADQHFLDHAGVRGRYVHRRLVRFERGDGVVHLDGVAHLHEQLDDRHGVEVADVRHLHLDHAAGGGRGGRGGRGGSGGRGRARGLRRSYRRGGRGGGGRWCGRCGARCLDLDQHRAFGHLVADI